MSDPLSTTFQALADPTRRAILARLALGEASVSDLAQPFATLSHPGDHFAEPGAVRDRGERTGLRDRAEAEMVAHPVEGGDQIRVADGIADPRPREAVRLGEGAHPDH